MTRTVNDHARIEERSLALHRLIAEKVLRDPALLEIASENIRRWRATDDGLLPAVVEWESILEWPAEAIASLLVEWSENATRLRQSTPFAGVLSESERKSVYESFATRARDQGSRGDLG